MKWSGEVGATGEVDARIESVMWAGRPCDAIWEADVNLPFDRFGWPEIGDSGCRSGAVLNQRAVKWIFRASAS